MDSHEPPGQLILPGTNSYIQAALGTALGTMIALPAGFIVAVLSFTLFGPERSGGSVILAILVASAWLGATLGCWLTLRAVGRNRAGRTALLLALAFPLAWLLSSSLPGPRIWPALLTLFALLTILALPARFVALRWLGSRKRAF